MNFAPLEFSPDAAMRGLKPLIIENAPFIRLNEVESLSQEAPPIYRDAYAQTLQWALNYLERPHADLGRKGAVCPYARRARLSGSIYITGLRGAPEFEKLCAFLLRLIPIFQKLPTPDDPLFRTILILMPDLKLEEADALFIRVLAKLRLKFVQRRQMLGEFHQGPPEKRGLHNKEFKPLYAPFPLMAIRSILPADIAFLKGDPQLEALHEKYFVSQDMLTPA